MPLTENEIKNLLSLDDARFRDVVMEICGAVGADSAKAAGLAADPKRLKAMISKMSADEVNGLIDKAGRERSENVLDFLKGKR